MSCSQVETVVGVHNAASSVINITVLAGSLNNAKAFSQHFQNFTGQVWHGLLPWAFAAGVVCQLWLTSVLPSMAGGQACMTLA